MLLINKITLNQLINYREDVVKCLKNNINNPYIKEILIFLEIVDDNLPKNIKIKYITKSKYSDIDVIEYSKRVSYEEDILFSKSLYIFGYEIKDIKYTDNYIQNDNFTFFKRDYNINPKLNKATNKKIKPLNKLNKNLLDRKKIEDKLDVVIVSVNYNDYLSLTLEENIKVFNNITVVTSESDYECQNICNTFDVNYIISEDILKDGLINKSIGINKGIKSLNNPDWILVLDADVVVKDKINIEGLDKRTLYTNSRWIINNINDYNLFKIGEKKLTDFKFEKDKGIGFFQLFNYEFKNKYTDSNWGRYSESTWSDVAFKREFKNIEGLELKTIHIGKPYQKWNKVEINKNYIKDNNILKISKRDPNIKPKLAVLTTFFNPKNYINLRYNYLKFSEKIKEKADLFPIELSFNDDFFIEDENVIQIKGTEENILWQKERLLNIALENLPKEYTNVAWIDCDVIFENENWAEEVNEKLKDYKVLHLFENAKRLDEKGDIDRVSEGIVKRIERTEIIDEKLGGIPGFGWVIRREVIDKIRFLDTQIIGGADALMFFSFFNMKNTIHHRKMNKEWYDVYMEWFYKSYFTVGKSVSYITGDIIHLYHGKMTNRNYEKRYEILSNSNFNPKSDLKINNGLWVLNKTDLVEGMTKYFESRNEDDNIIDINTYFDNIYVINLDRRKDRYEKIKYKLDKLNIKFERFSAIDGNNIKDEEYDFSGFIQGYGMLENKYALACFRSHVEIIKDAKSKSYKRILILEDDVLISSNIKAYLQRIRNIDNWKLLYLGSSQYNWNVEFIEGFFYSKKSLGTFAYAIDESMYEDLLNISERKSIDNILSDIQSKYYKECYTFYPNICISDVSDSDIRTERDQDSHSDRMRWNLLKNYI